MPSPEYAHAEHLADLARRCREVAQWTAVPEVAREIENIARALDEVAGSSEPVVSPAVERRL